MFEVGVNKSAVITWKMFDAEFLNCRIKTKTNNGKDINLI